MSKKRLFYVVKKKLHSSDLDDGIEVTTGYKTIFVYEIINHYPTEFCNIEILNEEDSIESITDFLNGAGYGEYEITLIPL